MRAAKLEKMIGLTLQSNEKQKHRFITNGFGADNASAPTSRTMLAVQTLCQTCA